MSSLHPFCPSCAAFFPAGDVCPVCKHGRIKLETPPAPDQPFWRTTLPGASALRPALAHGDGRSLLLLPWGNRERGDGGVVALDVSDGSKAWETPLNMPVEGGVAAAGSAGVAVVGLARRGHFSGEGAITALDLRTGQECWPGRVQAGGAVEAAPVTDDARAYVAANDGLLYCVDVLTGRLVWKKPVVDRAVRIPAAPALLVERGSAQVIMVGTYGITQWQDDGKLVAFDAVGRKLWEAPAGGQVRGAPVVVKGRVYVAAGRGSPATGVLSAFDLRTGRPIWPEPFTIPAPPGGRSDIVAAPLVIGGTVYVGSHDHRLHAVDIATGAGRWSHEVPRGIVSTAAGVEGLVVVGANDGVVYAADATTGARAWDYELGGHVQAGLVTWGDVIFAASDNGEVAALPWHAGRYAWAAERLETAQRWSAAGDCRALTGHFSVKLADQDHSYRRAVADWDEAGEEAKIAALWLGLGGRYRRAAADAFRKVGLARCGREGKQAAAYLKRAVDLYYEIYATEKLNDNSAELTAALNECTLALAECAGLPHVSVRLDNLNSLVQWESSQLALRLTNQGVSQVTGEVRIALGGGFAELVEAKLLGDLHPKRQWRVPVTAVATQQSSILEIEVEYDTGNPALTPLRTILLQPVKAAKRPRPLNINIGDVGVLKLAAGRADDGSVIQVVTRDVGLFAAREAQISKLDVHGDVGVLVGVDPATRQQIVDLRDSVGWLGERLAQIEASAHSPFPATREDLDMLREGLASHQTFFTRVIASLASDQHTAVAGLGVDIKQLSAKLEVLDRAQAEARRSQAQATPLPLPVDMATAHWSRRPDGFAERIEVSDLPGFLARGLVIEPGVLGIFLEDGRVELGQMGPGHYALDTLMDRMPGMKGIRRTTALVFEGGEITLAFEISNLSTVDGRPVTAQAELCFRLTDGMAFFVNYMQGRKQVLRSDLRDHLLPEVRDAAREWLVPRRSTDLHGSLEQKDALAAAVAEHLRETLTALGLRFERVRALAFQSS